MRDELAERAGHRLPYVATLQKYGVSHLGQGVRRKRRGTALLRDVRTPGGDFLTHHVWVPVAEPFVLAGIERGWRVSFTAIAEVYWRGYHYEGKEPDYMLTLPEDIIILSRGEKSN